MSYGSRKDPSHRESREFIMKASVFEHLNWRPGSKDLRFFGWGLGAASLVFGIMVTVRAGRVVPVSVLLWCLSAVLIGLGTVLSGALRWPYRIWMAITVPVGYILQMLMLCIFFYGILTPVALVLRLFGRDPLTRRFDAGAASYWVNRKRHVEAQRYFKQY